MTSVGGDRFDAIESAARDRAQRADALRLAAAAGLFEPVGKLSDERRSLIRQVADALTSGVLEGMRGALAGDPLAGPLRAQLADVSDVDFANRFAALPVLRTPALLGHLFRRADEFRLVTRLRRLPPADGRSSDALGELSRASDPGLAQAAMAVVVAQAARLQTGGSPRLPADDLPGDLFETLAWEVAAAVRQVAQAEAFDAAIQRAVRVVLADLVPGRSVFQRAARLAGALVRTGQDQDRALIDLLASGALHAVAAMLGLRADLPLLDCFDMMLDDDPVCWSILAAGAGFDANAATQVFALLGAAHGRPAAADAALAQYRGMKALRRAEILAWWRLDPAYRAAYARIAG